MRRGLAPVALAVAVACALGACKKEPATADTAAPAAAQQAPAPTPDNSLVRALEAAKGAIEEAITSEDGLDGARGEAVLAQIDEALASCVVRYLLRAVSPPAPAPAPVTADRLGRAGGARTRDPGIMRT